MKDPARRHFFVLLFLVALPCAMQAQSKTLVVEVQGLTSEIRDGISKDLRTSQDLKLVFTCVPAGIMVFEQPQPAERKQLEDRVKPVLEQRIHRSRVTMTAQDRSTAEERCAQARNQ